MIDDILAHYGVKGMKWGVRRKNIPKQGPSDDAKDAHRSFVKAKVSGVEALSNKELKAVNERLNLEMNYQRLSYNPGKLQKGLDAVKSMLKVGNTVNDAIQFANTPTGKAIASSFKPKTAKAATAATKTVKSTT